MFAEALPFLYKSQPDVNHTFIPIALLTVNMIFFAVSSWSDPGLIDKANHERYAKTYAYDNVMYKTHNNCRTCQFTKPARSKHCGKYEHKQFTGYVVGRALCRITLLPVTRVGGHMDVNC